MHMIPIGSGFISMDWFVWENLNRKHPETIVFFLIINYIYIYTEDFTVISPLTQSGNFNIANWKSTIVIGKSSMENLPSGYLTFCHGKSLINGGL